MTDLRQKLTDRMDQLQAWMEDNHHIKDNDSNMEVWDHCLNLSKFWSILNDEDKDYVDCAKDAVLERKRWNV
jgi:hypothetical protein